MSATPLGITVRELIEDTALGIDFTVAAGHGGLDGGIRATRIQKSGLALAGHFHGIESTRIQILGVTEMSYLRRLSAAQCQTAVRAFFERDLCCVVVTECAESMRRPAAAPESLIACADDAETPLLLSPERSSRTITAIHALLDERLAPRERIHGVLVDVFEVGLLLLGTSGVGKSEVGLELVMRGRGLVADDVVECHYRPPGMVFGAPADLLRHHLEVRGLGILNIKDLFGVTAIRERKRIDVVVRLVEDVGDGDYDRLGLDMRSHNILGVDVPEVMVPVRPGRDMASILEIAARNELLKLAGHHPAREFFGRLESSMMGHESEVPPSISQATGEAPVSTRSIHTPAPMSAIKPPPESSVGMPLTPRTPSSDRGRKK